MLGTHVLVGFKAIGGSLNSFWRVTLYLDAIDSPHRPPLPVVVNHCQRRRVCETVVLQFTLGPLSCGGCLQVNRGTHGVPQRPFDRCSILLLFDSDPVLLGSCSAAGDSAFGMGAENDWAMSTRSSRSHLICVMMVFALQYCTRCLSATQRDHDDCGYKLRPCYS